MTTVPIMQYLIDKGISRKNHKHFCMMISAIGLIAEPDFKSVAKVLREVDDIYNAGVGSSTSSIRALLKKAGITDRPTFFLREAAIKLGGVKR